MVTADVMRTILTSELFLDMLQLYLKAQAETNKKKFFGGSFLGIGIFTQSTFSRGQLNQANHPYQ